MYRGGVLCRVLYCVIFSRPYAILCPVLCCTVRWRAVNCEIRFGVSLYNPSPPFPFLSPLSIISTILTPLPLLTSSLTHSCSLSLPLSYPIPSFPLPLTYPSAPFSSLLSPYPSYPPFPSPLLSPLLVSSQCCEGGIISPASCVYITKWLSVPDDHSTNENYTW
jgi:hypothetical protein